ncbi:MAG: hypothetical protein OIF36_02120 [Alphaproteobacteria bacterium]|nr:hypothetical protein [Alphaproteobacteria bacterium]
MSHIKSKNYYIGVIVCFTIILTTNYCESAADNVNTTKVSRNIMTQDNVNLNKNESDANNEEENKIVLNNFEDLTRIELSHRYDVYDETTGEVVSNFDCIGTISDKTILDSYRDLLNAISVSKMNEENYHLIKENNELTYLFKLNKRKSNNKPELFMNQ